MLNIKTKSEVVLRQAIGAMRSREVVSLLSLIHSFLDSYDSGPFLSLQGQRGIGKTSLLKYLFEDEKKSKNFNSVIFLTAADFEGEISFAPEVSLLEHKTALVQEKILRFSEKISSERVLLIFDDIDVVSYEKLEPFIKKLRSSIDFVKSDSKIIFSYSQYLPTWEPNLLSHSNLLSLEIDENAESEQVPLASLVYNPENTNYEDVISVLAELDSIYQDLTGDRIVVNKATVTDNYVDGVL
jgi:hypothetical protein